MNQTVTKALYTGIKYIKKIDMNIFLSYCTSIQPPFYLVFGIEAVQPIQLNHDEIDDSIPNSMIKFTWDTIMVYFSSGKST